MSGDRDKKSWSLDTISQWGSIAHLRGWDHLTGSSTCRGGRFCNNLIFEVATQRGCGKQKRGEHCDAARKTRVQDIREKETSGCPSQPARETPGCSVQSQLISTNTFSSPTNSTPENCGIYSMTESQQYARTRGNWFKQTTRQYSYLQVDFHGRGTSDQSSRFL